MSATHPNAKLRLSYIGDWRRATRGDCRYLPSLLLPGEELLGDLVAGHVRGRADHRRGDREDAAQRNLRLAQLALHHDCAMQVQEVELLGIGVDLGLHDL